MFFFKKKKKQKEEEQEENAGADANAEPEAQAAPQQNASASNDAFIGRLTADVEKLKAQFSTFYELQKSSTERFSMINQQIGELRSMMIERDKASQHLEAKATQAIDLVKTVQPDKLMIELRKSDSKTEALKASMESYENIINNLINELKEVKNKIGVFRGMEQVISLNEEAKKELMDIKKIQAIVERHSDKVETIFTEMQKKFTDFAKFSDTVKDLDRSFKQINSDFDSIKVKMSDFSNKKEVENLISKFDDFEKYTGSIIKLINTRFEKLQNELQDEIGRKFEETDKLVRGFGELAQKTPDLDKYFHLLEEEAKKAPQQDVKVEKIKEMGEDTKVPVPEGNGIMGKFKVLAGRIKGK